MTFAYEFDARVEPGKPIELPKEVADQVPAGAHARIIVMIDVSPADTALQRASYDAFHKGYASEDDALYENYRPR